MAQITKHDESMSDYDRRSPIPSALAVLALVGGGWFFFQNFEIDGLDEISVYKRSDVADQGFSSYGDRPTFGLPTRPATESGNDYEGFLSTRYRSDNPFTAARRSGSLSATSTDVRSENPAQGRQQRVPNLRIGSWALDGFGDKKLDSDEVRQHIIRVLGQFDVVALQQITSSQRDVIPLLVDALNGTNRNGSRSRGDDGQYDYVLGDPVGPPDAREQLAFIFDTNRVRVDRSQTYTVSDPDQQMTYDPLVAWFQASEPAVDFAWTFSFVNVRIDLGRAPSEVALLEAMLTAIRRDGRGEDDVVMAGLLQADDAYLLPTILGRDVKAAVQKVSTEISGKHQTSNVLVDIGPTSEFVGRGGTLDFLRVYNLSLEEAKAVSNQLPVFAEFSALEGGVSH